MAQDEPRLYPNCDASVWLRSCEREVPQPLAGTLTGEIPRWLDGCLLRNGPGSLKVGAMEYKHLFDSSALLHRFAIRDGAVTYQCRFLQSQTLKKNRAANRIVVTEFGTKALPDPCHSIFQRVSALFRPGEGMSDNAMISVYPFGDEIYAFTESPVIHRIDPVTLETGERKNVSDYVSIVNHTSHPHVQPNGDVYNIGLSLDRGQVFYAIVKFPFLEKGDMFEKAEIVGKVRARWPLHPSYMHTFGITEHFFLVVEQPLSVSLCKMVRTQLTGDPLKTCFKWYHNQPTEIIAIRRSDGHEINRWKTDPLFYLHIINQYETKGHITLDLCSYKDPSMLDAMYVRSMKTMQSNAEYAEMFRGRPVRLELPLDSAARSYVKPSTVVDLGCETPRINYEKYCGRPYRYFYAISSDVDAENPGMIIKVDTKTGQAVSWCEKNCYPSEPVFVPQPNAEEEDDGVLLSALVWGGRDTHKTGLLVLSARSMKELARSTFATPSPSPKCLHGWFLSSTMTDMISRVEPEV